MRTSRRLGLLAGGGLAGLVSIQLCAQTPPVFDDYFTNAAVRFEFYQIGDAKEEFIAEHHFYLEPVWPENPRSLIQPFAVGRYALKVYDADSNRLLYSRGFNPFFMEYSTTKPALDGVKRAYETALRFPMPKKPVKVVIEKRDQRYVLHPLYATTVDPSDYHLLRESVDQGDWTFEQQKTGDPHDRVDLAFLAEGYTATDKDKFRADVDRFSRFLFTVEPYKSSSNKFNIYGVFRASPQRGVDEPRQRSYKATALDASYNAFDLDRYMLIEDSFALHKMAAQVPYDTIVVLVNSTRYGGGSICLDYCNVSVDNRTSLGIFIHEMGHSFAFLADEYTGDVAYNDFYPKGIEPIDPNITALLDPVNIKWKDLLTSGIAFPTPDDRPQVQALQRQLRSAQTNAEVEIAEAKARNAGDAEIKAMEDVTKRQTDDLQAKLTLLTSEVGAFEGAGYQTNGLYRSQMYCLMGSNLPNSPPQFCVVCRQAVQRMIDYFASGSQ